MNLNKENKPRLVIIVMLFCAIAVPLAIADRAPLHLEKYCPCVRLTTIMTLVVDGVNHSTAPGPFVYRVFIPYLAQGLHTVLPFLSLVNIDLVLKIFFLIICQFSFYYYLRIFFPSFVSLVGVFILDILLSFALSSIIGPSITENDDLMNLAIFTLSLIALNKNQLVYLLAFLFIGTFNRETTLLIIPIIFFNDYFSGKGIRRTLLACAAIVIPYLGLRIFIHSPEPNWFTFKWIIHNIPFLSSETTSNALIANAHLFFLLGPLIILSLMNYNKHPKFLRTASYITPLFIVVHYLVGRIIEVRLWIPLFVILIPLALNTLIMIFNTHSTSNAAIE